MTVSPRLMTAEDLERLSKGHCRRELIAGVLAEMSPVGGEHGEVTLRVGSTLRTFVLLRRLGKVVTETGFVLSRDPDTVRAPDIAFVSAARLGPTGLPNGYIEGAPDLAIEVVSPGDSADDIQTKLAEYLAAGTRLVWVLHPRSRTVLAVKADGVARVLGAGDRLDGDDVLPGFSILVDDLWEDRP